MCVPWTWNAPPPPLTVPAEVVASPQSMVAVKSEATFAARVSEKVATVAVKLTPGGAENVVGEPDRASASLTVAVSVAVAEPWPGGWSAIVTVTVKAPSSA